MNSEGAGAAGCWGRGGGREEKANIGQGGLPSGSFPIVSEGGNYCHNVLTLQYNIGHKRERGIFI